jgi:hypothetical protein
MSTATKTKPTTSVTAELKRLEEARAEAKTKVEAARGDVEAFDEGLGTLEKMRGENPHHAALRQARDESKQAQQALDQFKVTRITDRLAELEPDCIAAEQAIHLAAAALVQGCEMYRDNAEAAKAVVADTPRINRGREPGLGFDGRVAEWRKIVANIVDAEIARPGLTDLASWTLAQHG